MSTVPIIVAEISADPRRSSREIAAAIQEKTGIAVSRDMVKVVASKRRIRIGRRIRPTKPKQRSAPPKLKLHEAREDLHQVNVLGALTSSSSYTHTPVTMRRAPWEIGQVSAQ